VHLANFSTAYANGHPDASAGGIFALPAKHYLEGAFASTALTVLAEEYLAFATANAAKGGKSDPELILINS
jgi:hypothetical protein